MFSYQTPNRHGYSVRFSPFDPDRLAVATSQYFGLAGGGSLFILNLNHEANKLTETALLQWPDGLFDVVWSESQPSVLVTASGDGALQVWNLENGDQSARHILREHSKEVYSLDWSKTRSEQHILSASWDCTIKLWDPNFTTSLSTFSGVKGHSQLVYAAIFSPRIPNCFASVSGDGTLKLWGTNLNNSKEPISSFRVHDAEVLSCDWSKYDDNLIATSGSDGLIRGWDIRNYTQPVFQIKGGDYAIRRIQFSPFSPTVLASVGYDFTTRIWDCLFSNDSKQSTIKETIRHHSEFVYGLDWNSQRRGQLADCGWDSLVHVFTPNCLKECE